MTIEIRSFRPDGTVAVYAYASVADMPHEPLRSAPPTQEARGGCPIPVASDRQICEAIDEWAAQRESA